MIRDDEFLHFDGKPLTMPLRILVTEWRTRPGRGEGENCPKYTYARSALGQSGASSRGPCRSRMQMTHLLRVGAART